MEINKLHTKEDIANYIINIGTQYINNIDNDRSNILFIIFSRYKSFDTKYLKIIIDKGIDLFQKCRFNENILLFLINRNYYINYIKYFYDKNNNLINSINDHIYTIFEHIDYRHDKLMEFFNKNNIFNKIHDKHKGFILTKLLSYHTEDNKNREDICYKLFIRNDCKNSYYGISYYELSKTIIKYNRDIKFIKLIICENNNFSKKEKEELFTYFIINNISTFVCLKIFNKKLFELFNDYDFNENTMIYLLRCKTYISRINNIQNIHINIIEQNKEIEMLLSISHYNQSKKL